MLWHIVIMALLYGKPELIRLRTKVYYTTHRAEYVGMCLIGAYIHPKSSGCVPVSGVLFC